MDQDQTASLVMVQDQSALMDHDQLAPMVMDEDQPAPLRAVWS